MANWHLRASEPIMAKHFERLSSSSSKRTNKRANTHARVKNCSLFLSSLARRIHFAASLANISRREMFARNELCLRSSAGACCCCCCCCAKLKQSRVDWRTHNTHTQLIGSNPRSRLHCERGNQRGGITVRPTATTLAAA